MVKLGGRIVLTAIVATCLVVPALAARKPGGGGTSGSCATVSVGVSTPLATAGISSVGVYGPVTNCSSGKARYDVIDTFRSACGGTSVIHIGSVSFDRGGESVLVSTGFAVPAGTCTGIGTVTRTISAGTVLASSSVNLTIQSR